MSNDLTTSSDSHMHDEWLREFLARGYEQCRGVTFAKYVRDRRLAEDGEEAPILAAMRLAIRADRNSRIKSPSGDVGLPSCVLCGDIWHEGECKRWREPYPAFSEIELRELMERGDVRCSGCGTLKTMEQILAETPHAIACCPERKLVACK